MRGKEVYFDQNTTEFTFLAGMEMKTRNLNWTIRTDDWGYFYRAFCNYMSGSNNYWKDYDAFLGIILTSSFSGVLWIFGLYLEYIRLFKKGSLNSAKVLYINK